MRKLIQCALLIGIFSSCSQDATSEFNFGEGSGVQAVTGSTASFQAVNGFLYLMGDGSMKVFDIRGETPSQLSTIAISSLAETIFSYGDNLLLGTQSGMIIYDISIPSNPQLISQVDHQTACDPVIAKDQIAYLTIRSGVGCNNAFPVNTLVVLDISDLENPIETHRIQMNSPRGLAISNGRLFVGEGAQGMQQFSLADPELPVFEMAYSGIQAEDLIALDQQLIITGPNGVLQYTNNDGTLEYLSSIQ